MKKTILTLIAAVTLTACQSTENTSENVAENSSDYSSLEVTHNEMLSNKWGELLRFPARYPEQAAFQGLNGCATVEYVITPDNKVTSIEVVAESSWHFGRSATNVIQNWAWDQLLAGIISEPVKTQTRFDFCIESAEQPCSRVTQQFSCPGEDIIQSIGRRVM